MKKLDKKNAITNPGRPCLCRSFAVLLLVLTVILGNACSQQAFMAKLPPYLPPNYYQCIEVTPGDLVNSYFSGYANTAQAEVNYNDRIFVFKHLPVKEWMIEDVDQGFIWVGSGIKCILADVDAMDDFKLEEFVDVVGLNAGILDPHSPGLLFKNCYVLPEGTVQLPAGDSGGFVPAY